MRHSIVRVAALGLLVSFIASSAAGLDGDGVTIRPLVVQDRIDDSLRLGVEPAAYASLKTGSARRTVVLPTPDDGDIVLDLERFDVFSATSRVVMGLPGGGDVPRPRPDLVTLRGSIEGRPGTHAFIALTGDGTGNGYVTLETGEQYVMATPADAPRGASALTLVRQEAGGGGLPEFEEFCAAVDDARSHVELQVGSGVSNLAPGPRLAFVAVDADQQFYQLFFDLGLSEGYVAQVIAAVSDIYQRDLDVRLILSFTRVWPLGGEPFGADSLSGFRDHWEQSEDPSPYDLIHLMSGRRDLSYGGVAYVSGACGQAYGISGLLLGSFPSPVDGPDLGNWDLVVVAHEMGHNMGTSHTHSGYAPPIDDCGSLGIHTRGTIMSYCHTTAGGLLNIEMRFHGRVQDLIAADVSAGSCLVFDCNGNDIDDVDDIAMGASDDLNGNGIPDECDDCDGNGTLDDMDIALGAPDVNGNGIPDACEADCNGNGTPDEHEIDLAAVPDANGNRIPDGCEPDCDANGTADHVDITANELLDLDRNGVLDSCQDCDGNMVVDWIDLDRQFNLYVADQGALVREYHGASGVAVQDLGAGLLSTPRGAAFGSDRLLYVSSYDDDTIVRVDPDTGVASVFVAAGLGGLDGPTGLQFTGAGTLLVCSFVTGSVIEYDATGASLGEFVSAGSGGLVGPWDLAYARSGNLLVTADDDRVLEYDGATGAFVSEFTPGGGLSGARGIAVTEDGHVLVASLNNDSVIEFDQVGASLGAFTAGPAPTAAWGIEIGPNGNLFVSRSSGAIRVLEYDLATGLYIRSFVRGDAALLSPTMFAWRGASDQDCNLNLQLDSCDVQLQVERDCNGNAIPDTCDLVSGAGMDANGTGILDFCEARGDNNGDGAVDVGDLLNVLAKWGPCPPPCPEDADGNGEIDVDDLLNVLANWD